MLDVGGVQTDGHFNLVEYVEGVLILHSKGGALERESKVKGIMYKAKNVKRGVMFLEILTDGPQGKGIVDTLAGSAHSG